MPAFSISTKGVGRKKAVKMSNEVVDKWSEKGVDGEKVAHSTFSKGKT